MKTKVITLIVAVLAVAAIILSGVIVNSSRQEVNQLNSKKVELENNLTERDSLVNEFISAFDTIEHSLTFINERRSQLILENTETNPSRQEAIISDIKMMNTMLEESSNKIEELEKKLKSSGIQLRSFRNKIARMNKNIEQQNQQIDELKYQVEKQNEELAMVASQKDSLQNEVFSIQDSVILKEEIIQQKEEIIDLQISEINKGYLAYGTVTELIENDVITKEGGFLGIGRNKTLQNNFNEDYFTKIDINENRSFLLNAKKVNFISEHPSDSYKLVEEEGLITKLEIENPNDFWKVSNYAVIEVK
ncbi:MAG: hypothetical protein ABFS16_07600 [Bacteroidota bacterium]